MHSYGVDIFVFDDLLAKLKTDDEYVITEIGEFELRGKDEKVKIQTVAKIN